jgi:hypothetical protein
LRQRSRYWSAALVQYAVARNPASIELLKQWVEQWKPLTYRGKRWSSYSGGLHPQEPDTVSAKVRAPHDNFLARVVSMQLKPERIFSSRFLLKVFARFFVSSVFSGSEKNCALFVSPKVDISTRASICSP